MSIWQKRKDTLGQSFLSSLHSQIVAEKYIFFPIQTVEVLLARQMGTVRRIFTCGFPRSPSPYLIPISLPLPALFAQTLGFVNKALK